MKLSWNDAPLVLIVVFAIFVVYSSMTGFLEHFARFEDTSNRDKTDALANSSYRQTTNHMRPPDKLTGPIPGTETPFRVNMFHAYL
jgi:hypothetical protein